MTKTSKIFLAISVAAFSLSLTEGGGDIGWGILRPLGAVAFVLFFITHIVAKEVAQYDREERGKPEEMKRSRTDSHKAGPSPGRLQSSTKLRASAAH